MHGIALIHSSTKRSKAPEKVQPWLDGKPIRKVIAVAGRD